MSEKKAAEELRKVEAECNRLNQELEKLNSAIPTSQACKELIDYVNSQEEPFSADYKPTNPWVVEKPNGCCTII